VLSCFSFAAQRVMGIAVKVTPLVSLLSFVELPNKKKTSVRVAPPKQGDALYMSPVTRRKLKSKTGTLKLEVGKKYMLY
jgi:hypothetical protein